MRKIALFVMTILLAVACGTPAAEDAQQAEPAVSPQQVQQEVEQMERDWATAVVAQDFAKLDQIYHGQLLYAHSSGMVESKSEYMDKLQTGTSRYDSIEHESIDVRPFDGFAIAHSRIRMHGENNEGPFHYLFMMIHVWVDDGGQWRLAAHQTTRLEVLD